MIRYCAEHDLVDCLVTSAGGIEEDIVKCLKPSFLGAFNMDGAALRLVCDLNISDIRIIGNEESTEQGTFSCLTSTIVYSKTGSILSWTSV